MREVGRNWSGARLAAMAMVAMAAVVLGGCGSSGSDSGTGGASASTKTGTKGPKATRPDMVAAVSSSKSPGAVEVRFTIPERPIVGQPLDIQLSLTPSIELERLVAHFQVPEGLQLVSGAETAHYDRPALGTEISHTVTVVPKADGIYNITAVVLTDSDKESIARMFSIPLIAGAGLADLPPTANGTTP